MAVEFYLNRVAKVLGGLDVEAIESVVRHLYSTYERGGSIVAFGNGGSAATASHFVGDLIKGVSYGLEKRVRALCLNDNVPAMMAIANDISYDMIFKEQLLNHLSPGDIVLGFSGSGNSANVVHGLAYAREAGARTVAVCGYHGGKIKKIADHVLHVDIEDMEISEDVHLVICHAIKNSLIKMIKDNRPQPSHRNEITHGH